MVVGMSLMVDLMKRVYSVLGVSLLVASGMYANEALANGLEEELWVANTSNANQLNELLSDKPIEQIGNHLSHIQDPACAAKLAEKLSGLSLNVETVNQKTLCEIVAAEVEWDVTLRALQQILPSIDPQFHSSFRE